MTGGLVPVDFWSRAIPQSCYNEKAVRYAALGVGAMSLALTHKAGLGTTAREAREHFTNALTYHAEALRLVRQATQNNIRIAVVSCILFHVYAAIAEEEETATRHIIHGIMILEQFIGSQFDTSLGMMKTSSTAFQVEDEIFRAFNRIAYNFLVHKYLLQPRELLPGDIFLQQPATKAMNEIPVVFEDLTQANRWWDMLLANVADSARWRLKLTTRYPYPDWVSQPEVCDVKHENIGAMEAWHRAFGPLYHHVCDTQQERFDDFIRAIRLEVQFLTHRASICTLGGSCSYDRIVSLTPDFTEIVRLLEILLHFQLPPLSPGDVVVTLDMGHVLSLHLVAMNCRDAMIQQRAIDLLEKYPRRDGLWDSRAVVAVARLNVIVEQENQMAGGMEEQWDRLTHREITINGTQHQGTFKSLRQDPINGIWVTREETFTW